ncbi:MAG: primosomal protein N', partial [Gammaproteobacteria bacterium]
MIHDPAVLKVALKIPLRECLDYLPPCAFPIEKIMLGMRLRVPFRRGVRIGVLMQTSSHSRVQAIKLRRAIAVLDEQPVVTPKLLELIRWAADYYHHPIGEVVASALPGLLHRGPLSSQAKPASCRWLLDHDPGLLKRAPRQAAIVELLRQHPSGLSDEDLDQRLANWRKAMHHLVAQGYVEAVAKPAATEPSIACLPAPPLNSAQRRAVQQIASSLDRFQPFLLDGVTGSGKTEVYLRLIEEVLRGGKQALMLVPEIGLIPQALERLSQRFREPVAVMHSDLGTQQRLGAWLNAREGTARIVLGTRSAVWTPLPYLGLIVVDEEHDSSYKQQEGFPYSARDVAVIRAQRENIPIVLGSATPSLESIVNAQAARYRELRLPHRAGSASTPTMKLLDIRAQTLHGGISQPLLAAIAQRLERREQTLLFINRRGYAPLLLCHRCGWYAACTRCDAKLAYHSTGERLRCHHCGHQREPPAACPAGHVNGLIKLGQGTERVAEVLKARFPGARLVRIDKDTTRRKGSLETLLQQVDAGEADILVGTQMLSKGHHFPRVTLVGVVDADSRLYSVDFRAGEKLAQLVVQVAGRAGRAEKPGLVLIQTHYPEHPLLAALLTRGYGAFAQSALSERRASELPPYQALALLRAESPDREAPMHFLKQARGAATEQLRDGLQVFGPVPAPMERRAGRSRAQLMLQSIRRRLLHQMLEQWLPRVEALKSARTVRWSLDVDPHQL